MKISRRAAAVLFASTPGALMMVKSAAAAAERVPDTHRIGGFALGCQAYSFNRYSVVEAIEKTAQAGGKIIEFYPGQRLGPNAPGVGRLNADASDEVITQVKAQLDKSGVRAAAFGVVNLGKDEAANRRVFEFAKKMGIGTLTCEPDASAMDNIEKLVKEYDVRLAIHNHPRQGNNANYRYWDPAYVLSLVKDRDPRIGSCADTGHWVRSGIKPLDAVRLLKGRVLGLHLKDLNVFAPNARDTPFGTGVGEISGILQELRRNKFDGHVSIEYEHNWENSVPDIAQCIGYVRGWAATEGISKR